MSEDTVGCIIGAGLLIFAGYWLYDRYEIKRRDPEPIVTAAPYKEPRPTGIVTLSTDKNGSIWRVDADSVRGARNKRQGWVLIDSANDKTDDYNESRTLTQADCDTTASRDLSVAHYNKKGVNTFSFSETPEKAPVHYYPPRTFGATVLNFICDKRFDRPTDAPTKTP